MPLLLPLALAAPPPVPHFRATRVDKPPVLDGRLDDDAWRAAPADDAFTQKSPRESAAPTERTTVRVVYDDDAIYVAVDCEQDGAPVVARLTRRDREVEADWVSVSLDTRRDGKGAFVFEVNAGGALVDGVRFNDTDFSIDWDENWDARVSSREHGWAAEFRVPLRVLRFESRTEQSWGFEVRRYISEKQETDEWALISRMGGGEVSHYGKLDGLTGLRSRTPFELRPFVLGRVRRQDSTTLGVPVADGSTLDNPIGGGTDFTPSAGLDLKWHPSQELTLDATLNPDFAQVEADQIVLNLTTFETFYPEKRPFFLEGIDQFATPGQLLYTRRIGRSPPLPTLLPGERVLDLPQPTTIYGASKLTGSIADGWTIGTLQALTAPATFPVMRAGGLQAARVVEPTTGWNVLRLKRDIGRQGFVGLMATSVTRAERDGDWPLYGSTQLCPGGTTLAPGARCFSNAQVGAFDWRWRSPGGDWVTFGQAAASRIADGPPRTVPDGTTIRPGDVGKGLSANVAKEGGEHWVGDLGLTYLDRKYDHNDLGFLDRANRIDAYFDAEYRDLVPRASWLESHQRLETWQSRNVDGLMTSQGYQLNTSGKLSSFWSYFAEVHWRGTRFDDREVGDGTALERAGRLGWEARVTSNTTKPVSFTAFSQLQYLSDGYNVAGRAGVTLRALPQLDFELLPTWQFTAGEPRYVGSGVLSGQYLFGRQNAKSLGATLRATYTFTPRLTLQTYAQLFLASGHYSDFTFFQSDPNGPRAVVHLDDLRAGSAPPGNPDFEQGVLNVNVVLRWEWQLGSLLYVVYTRAQVPNVSLAPGEVGTLDLGAVKRAPAADALLVKLSYWWGG